MFWEGAKLSEEVVLIERMRDEQRSPLLPPK
jgi:hypothetical protein